MQSTALKSRIDENKYIICQIVHAALFLGKQGLALRGDTEIYFIFRKKPREFFSPFESS